MLRDSQSEWTELLNLWPGCWVFNLEIHIIRPVAGNMGCWEWLGPSVWSSCLGIIMDLAKQRIDMMVVNGNDIAQQKGRFYFYGFKNCNSFPVDIYLTRNCVWRKKVISCTIESKKKSFFSMLLFTFIMLLICNSKQGPPSMCSESEFTKTPLSFSVSFVFCLLFLFWARISYEPHHY